MISDLIIGLGALVLGILLIAVGIQGMRKRCIDQEIKQQTEQEDADIIVDRIVERTKRSK